MRCARGQGGFRFDWVGLWTRSGYIIVPYAKADTTGPLLVKRMEVEREECNIRLRVPLRPLLQGNPARGRYVPDNLEEA